MGQTHSSPPPPSSPPPEAKVMGSAEAKAEAIASRQPVWVRARAAAMTAAGGALDSAARAATGAVVRVGASLASQVRGVGVQAGERLHSVSAAQAERVVSLVRGVGVQAGERLHSVSAAQAERVASLARAATARISVAAVGAAYTSADRFVPNFRARLIRFRNRSIFGVLACVFVYAAGSATPQALGNYQLALQQRVERRQAELATAERTAERAPTSERTPTATWRGWLGLGPER
ncbi:hypothetical protein T492DRAFT_1072957 [Pavlovales sp. CCMP2436]|nr:hypothetical protein T492DRAFT_1072957 [Pavlovales sp. CCMP2436]